MSPTKTTWIDHVIANLTAEGREQENGDADECRTYLNNILAKYRREDDEITLVDTDSYASSISSVDSPVFPESPVGSEASASSRKSVTFGDVTEFELPLDEALAGKELKSVLQKKRRHRGPVTAATEYLPVDVWVGMTNQKMWITWKEESHVGWYKGILEMQHAFENLLAEYDWHAAYDSTASKHGKYNASYAETSINILSNLTTIGMRLDTWRKTMGRVRRLASDHVLQAIDNHIVAAAELIKPIQQFRSALLKKNIDLVYSLLEMYEGHVLSVQKPLEEASDLLGFTLQSMADGFQQIRAAYTALVCLHGDIGRAGQGPARRRGWRRNAVTDTFTTQFVKLRVLYKAWRLVHHRLVRQYERVQGLREELEHYGRRGADLLDHMHRARHEVPGDYVAYVLGTLARHMDASRALYAIVRGSVDDARNFARMHVLSVAGLARPSAVAGGTAVSPIWIARWILERGGSAHLGHLSSACSLAASDGGDGTVLEEDVQGAAHRSHTYRGPATDGGGLASMAFAVGNASGSSRNSASFETWVQDINEALTQTAADLV